MGKPQAELAKVSKVTIHILLVWSSCRFKRTEHCELHKKEFSVALRNRRYIVMWEFSLHFVSCRNLHT